MGLDEVLHWYVPEYEWQNIFREVHGGVIGGNYAGKETTRRFFEKEYGGQWYIKILRSIVLHVMCVRGLEDYHEEMNFP